MAIPTPARASRKPGTRVPRVYTLPVEAFDILKAHQRQLQLAADQTARDAGLGVAREVTNSEALADLLGLLSMLSASIATQSIPPKHTRGGLRGYISGLYFGDLKVTPGAAQ